MLLINDKGNIIGYNKTLDTKPAPFVSKTATWTGSDWQYNDTKECVPDFFNMNAIDCFQLHSYIMSLISPEPGIKVKEKSKDITVLIPSFGKKEYINYANTILNTIKDLNLQARTNKCKFNTEFVPSLLN